MLLLFLFFFDIVCNTSRNKIGKNFYKYTFDILIQNIVIVIFTSAMWQNESKL